MNEAALSPASAISDLSQGGCDILDAPRAWVERFPVAIYACDAAGRLRWFNGRAAAIWGRAPRLGGEAERFCGAHKVSDLEFRPVARSQSPMAEVLRTGCAMHGAEARIERPDGTEVVAMLQIDPVKDSGGTLLGAIGCLHETTAFHRMQEELHRSQDQLRQNEQRLSQLLEALPAAVYTTDAAGRITYYNRAAVDLAGREPKIGSDEWCVTWRLYSPDGTPMPHDRCPMAIALKESRPVRGVEAVAERPDGTRVPFIPFPTPLRDSDGEVVGAVNMLVDISERKSAETQQKVLLDELNHRVKNNMQMLYALLRGAQRETRSAEARSVLSEASQRVAAMAAAQRVLYGAGESAEFDIEDFLEAVCESARQGFGKDIRIACESISGSLSNDTAMPLALILNELLTNAARHGCNGRGAVAIEVGLTESDGSYMLRVEDDGPGFRFSEGRKRSSGLGLVVGLVRQLGGTFAVDGTSGARCTVRFHDSRTAH